ncbi:MAG: hypothetical protein OHK0022_40830 [Roseiflexaceae bacterium]
MKNYESEAEKKEKEDFKKAKDDLKKFVKSKDYTEVSTILKQVYGTLKVASYAQKLIYGIKVGTLLGLIESFFSAADAFVKIEALKQISQATGLAHDINELAEIIKKSKDLSKDASDLIGGGVGIISGLLGVLDDHLIQSREFHAVRTAADIANNIVDIKKSVDGVSRNLNAIRGGPMIPEDTYLTCTGSPNDYVQIKVTHTLASPVRIGGKHVATVEDNQACKNIPMFKKCCIATDGICKFKPEGLWQQGIPIVCASNADLINSCSILICAYKKGIITPHFPQDIVSAGLLTMEALGVVKNANEALKNSVELISTIEGEDEKEKDKDKSKDKQQGSK